MRAKPITIAGTAISIALTACRATPPTYVETTVIGWTKHNITVRGKTDRNPIPATQEKIESGKQIFGLLHRLS